ncbi:hypothetical protein VTI74DRAFT_9548 [Chaetomium olivicolor]
MDVPLGLTVQRAQQIRTAVTVADSRKDYRDRHLLYQSSSHRIAKKRFWEDGLLLPFGSQHDDFQEPNPTFFQDTETWPMHDYADPLNGWSLKEVEECPSGPATVDIYGKLFYHVGAMLRAFLVSNISDSGYLGIHHTIAFMPPLLQGPLVNPHATLITLFMNAVDENTTDEDRIADLAPHSSTMERLLKYLPRKGMPASQFDPELMKLYFSCDIVANHEHVFDLFVKNFMLSEAAKFFGAAMKEKHTVIEKWPFRLKLRPGHPGAQEEFAQLLTGGVSGKERYVEWKRIPMYEDVVNSNSKTDLTHLWGVSVIRGDPVKSID